MKIEMKWSLWLAEITSWCYSDWNKYVIVVSANTYEEAKNAVKIYYQNKEKTYWKKTLTFTNDWEQWQYEYENEYIDNDNDTLFDNDYGRWEDVHLSRLSVVYDWWEVAKKSLHIKD